MSARSVRTTLSDITTDFARCEEVFKRHGCFVVDDALEPAMVDKLEQAARRVVARVRSGTDAFSASVGNSPDATQIGALITPEYRESAFHEMMGSDSLARYAERLLPGPIRLWFCAMWSLDATDGERQRQRETDGERTQRRRYDTGWHRDTHGIFYAKEGEGEDRELALLGYNPEQVGKALKWNTCLTDSGDACLFLLPGSHQRRRTPAERRVLYAARNEPIDGELRVVLSRGQTVFFAGTLIHRGYQDPEDSSERLSMTCGLQAHNDPSVPLYLLHQWEWCKSQSIATWLARSARALAYWQRWVEACDGGIAAGELKRAANL